MLDQARKNQIYDCYNRVLERIENAKAHRNAGSGEVTLLAATKTVPAEEVLYAASLGLKVAGENKVQELTEKYDALKDALDMQFIGHLQTNKVRQVVGKASVIHSVDSMRLAEEIGKKSVSRGVVTDVLCEINIGREESKGGVMPEKAKEFAAAVNGVEGIRLRGLMTMAPVCESDEYRKYFAETYQIFVDILQNSGYNINEPILSMGMSDSFEEAIAEGSTLVRVGSAIFGRRAYGLGYTENK
jgi:hypothetical protein